MENENKQNQSSSSSANNSSSGNSSKSNNSSNAANNSGSGQRKPSDTEAKVLTLLQPHDMSRTVESALHVFQGRHEKLPDLMQDVGNIILRATRRFSTTQLVLAAGALTIGAVLLAKYSEDIDFDFEE